MPFFTPSSLIRQFIFAGNIATNVPSGVETNLAADAVVRISETPATFWNIAAPANIVINKAYRFLSIQGGVTWLPDINGSFRKVGIKVNGVERTQTSCMFPPSNGVNAAYLVLIAGGVTGISLGNIVTVFAHQNSGINLTVTFNLIVSLYL